MGLPAASPDALNPHHIQRPATLRPTESTRSPLTSWASDRAINRLPSMSFSSRSRVRIHGSPGRQSLRAHYGRVVIIGHSSGGGLPRRGGPVPERRRARRCRILRTFPSSPPTSSERCGPEIFDWSSPTCTSELRRKDGTASSTTRATADPARHRHRRHPHPAHPFRGAAHGAGPAGESIRSTRQCAGDGRLGDKTGPSYQRAKRARRRCI